MLNKRQNLINNQRPFLNLTNMFLKSVFAHIAFYSFVSGVSLSKTVPRTVEVYWESYLGFPNDAKSCKLKTRSNWIEEERIKRHAFDIPFGIELVSISKTFITDMVLAQEKMGIHTRRGANWGTSFARKVSE